MDKLLKPEKDLKNNIIIFNNNSKNFYFNILKL